MSDIELNPTGEMLLDCMDKLERIQAKHAALVEAVKESIILLPDDIAGFDTIEDQNAYVVSRLSKALAAAQEADE